MSIQVQGNGQFVSTLHSARSHRRAPAAGLPVALNHGKRPFACGASAWDGYAATHIAQVSIRALETGARQTVSLPDQPGLYR